LDSARSGDVLALLRTFNRERGQTVVHVTHDAEVGATCDRIIRMRDGLIVGDERVAQAAGPVGAEAPPLISIPSGAAIPVALI
jgi:ABC-type lipoprotein export system ATPase subunit